MNDSDTPSQYRLLKAARRTTRAEVTLVTIVTIITLWSFYALYKLSIGGSDSLLSSSVLSRARNSMFGHQDQQSVNVEVNETPNYTSQERARSQSGSSPAQNELNNRKNSKFQQEVESKFREQLIREILSKQRELYGDRLVPSTYSKIFWPNEFDLRRPLSPMWLNTKNKTTLAPPINKSIIMMRHVVDPDLTYKQITKQPKDDRLTTLSDSYGLPIRRDRDIASRDIDRDVEESISIDRTAMTTPKLPADSESSINHQGSRQEESADNDSSGDKDDAAPHPEDDTDIENNDQPETLAEKDQQDLGESDYEVNKDTRDSNDDTGVSNDDTSEKSDPIDDASLDRAKKALTSIDEEVDRMTQPSSGNFLQHNDTKLDKDSLQDLLKGAVQFDDSLGGSTVDPAHKKLPKPIEPGGLIAQFASPVDEMPKKKKILKLVRHIPTKSPITNGKQRHGDELKDLQIDHDHLARITSSKSTSTFDQRHGGGKRSIKHNYDEPRPKLNQSLESSAEPKRKNSRRRDRRSLDEYDSNDKSSHARFGITITRPRRPKRLNLRRRTSNNDFDKYDENSDEDKKRKSTIKKDEENIELKVTPKPEIDSIYENFTMPAASDISIQDLLAHKRLLDELDKSRLPPPHYWTGLQNDNDKIVSAAQPVASNPLKKGDSSYDAIHSSQVETEVEDQSRKSGTKKGSNNSDSKAKIKLSESLKKGGAKSKKHNKEEKKYLKEKKFKGAKSGKKTAKGKGGKGGKKGTKYYKDKGFKKKGFKNIYVKNEFGQKKSYFDEFRDKDFKKKWKNFDDKYNYAQMKKWQSKDVKGAKKMKDKGEKFKDYDKSRYKKKYQSKQSSEASKKKKNYDEF